MARFTLLAALLLVGCQSGSDYSMEAPDYADESYAIAEEQAASPARQVATSSQVDLSQESQPERQLIRRATLRLRVDDYGEARAAVTHLAEEADAYIGGEEERRYPGRIENTITIRVRADRFETLMDAFVALGIEVDSRTVEVEDVTRQYVDLEARLGTRRAVAERMQTLLGRAGSISDILAVQTQLAQVQEEIDAAEGQLRYLRNQVSLSTITLTLFEESSTGLVSGPTFLSRIGRAFESGWEGALGLLLVAVALWPFWVLLAAAVVLVRRFRRRRRGLSSKL